MKKRFVLVIYAIFLCTYSSYSIAGDASRYLSVSVLADTYRLTLSYSFYKDRVILYKQGMQITLQPGTDIVLINSKAFQLPYAVYKTAGNIFVPKGIVHYLQNASATGLSIQEIPPRQITLPQSETEDGNSEPITNSVSDFVVVLDAGHGGKDPGTLNRDLGIYEKDLVLSIALLTYKYLKKNYGLTPVLTRSSDRFLDLEERATIANSRLKQGGRGVFISFHVNYSLFNSQSRGIETFYYSPKPYSEREKKILNYRLANISRVYYNGKLQGNNLKIASRMLELKLGRMSRSLATNIQNGIIKKIGRRVPDRGIKQDRFFVLAHTVMPSVLLELGFLSNKAETRRLMTSEYQKMLAKGIAEGIIRYIKNYR